MKTLQGTPSPVTFYEEEVYPAVFDSLDRVFPELKLKRTSRGWTATDEAETHAVFGARADRVVCNRPGGFLVHGGEAVSWTAYVSGRTSTPTGADFVEAVKELARRAGVDLSPLERELTPAEAAEVKTRERRRDLLEVFVEKAHAALLADVGKAAREYLVGRGFSEDKLEDLPLGFYPNVGTVSAAMKAKGYTAEELDASGILADGRWEGRLLIPWRDARGHVATVAARDLTGTAEDGDKYRYLKGATKPPAFGLDVAKRSQEATDGAGLLLVEGLMDVVLLQSQGFNAAAALGGSGSFLTAERWAELIRLGFPAFTLCLDSDDAGRAGTMKALDNLRKVDNPPKVYVVTPEALGVYKDPDELVRAHGYDKLLEVINVRSSLWPDYYGRRVLGDLTPESEDRPKREAVEKVLDFASSLRGPRAALDSEDLLRRTSEATGYTYEALAAIALTERERKDRERAEQEAKAAARELQDALSSPGANVYELASDTSARLASLQGRAADVPPPFSVDAMVAELKNAPEGLLSGWPAVDELGVRFQPKELSVLGARTGHGKTSALVGLLHNWLDLKADAIDDILNSITKKPLVFFSHEEPAEVVFSRLVALATADNPTPWTSSEVRDYLRDPESRGPGYGWPSKNLDEVLDAFRKVEDRLVVVHRPAWSASRIAAHARELAETRGVGAVFVDYLQRIPPEAKADRRDMEVSAIGRTLKSLAVDLSVPVVVGAQINREAIPPKYQETIQSALGEGVDAAVRKMKAARPDLHNLREGGSEQEADLVLGLMNYAADLRTEADSDHATNLYEVGVLKNRYGQVGRWAALAFEGASGLIRDRDPRKDAF